MNRPSDEIRYSIVKRALEHIDEPLKWCKNADAQTKDGESVEEYHRDAYSLSLLSAITRACEECEEFSFFCHEYDEYLAWIYWRTDWTPIIEDITKERNWGNCVPHLFLEVGNTDLQSIFRDVLDDFNNHPQVKYEHIRMMLEGILNEINEQWRRNFEFEIAKWNKDNPQHSLVGTLMLFPGNEGDAALRIEFNLVVTGGGNILKEENLEEFITEKAEEMRQLLHKEVRRLVGEETSELADEKDIDIV